MTGHSEEQQDDLEEDEERSHKLAALHIKTVKEGRMHNKILTMGFVTGVVVGGVVALLYAPKAGKETREFLKSKAEYTKEEALVLAEHAKQVALEKARQAKAAAEAVAREVEKQHS
jgi:gas vesicle protein